MKLHFPSLILLLLTTTTTTSACVDSSLRLKINVNGNIIARSCTWVAAKDTNARCQLSAGVDAACPVTCGTCATCADPDPLLRFKFEYVGNEISRNCEFVGRVAEKVDGRCAASGNICRATCGEC